MDVSVRVRATLGLMHRRVGNSADAVCRERGK